MVVITPTMDAGMIDQSDQFPMNEPNNLMGPLRQVLVELIIRARWTWTYLYTQLKRIRRTW